MKKHKEHSTTHQPTQAHMEAVLCPAHSLLSWHTPHQLTREFLLLLADEGGGESQRPHQTSPQLASQPTFFFLSWFLLVTHD
uniref:Uncharacterized protein n=1 Tax=Arundo donax TaxID=35708 RepID=A0A0A9EQJ1_ARUDO